MCCVFDLSFLFIAFGGLGISQGLVAWCLFGMCLLFDFWCSGCTCLFPLVLIVLICYVW